MKGIDTILEHLFRQAHKLDRPAQPKRGRTAEQIYREHATRAPHRATPRAIRVKRRKAAHESRRRNRSTK